MKRVLFAAFTISIFAAFAFAQSGTLRGKVVNAENDPVVGATVTIESTDNKATSGVGGTFEFESLGDGNYTIIVSADGYQPASREISYSSGNATPLIIKVERLTATVDVDGRIGDYHTDDTTVFTKIPTRLIDTPQAITSVSPQLISGYRSY